MKNPQRESRSDAISFQELSEADFPLLQKWFSEPHVAEWWNERFDLESVRAKYRPRIAGTEPTHVFVIKYRDRPVGLIQWYLWSDYPNHAQMLEAKPEWAGVDLAIGVPEILGQGIGSEALGKFCQEVIFADTGVSVIVSDPEEANIRSVRAFQKVGFTVMKKVTLRGESRPRPVVRLNMASSRS